MICIKCEDEMQKTFFKGIVVDYCRNCKSFWLDKDEFENAVNGNEMSPEECSDIAIKEKKEEIIQTHSDKICPKCRVGKLVETIKFGAELEVCTKCEGCYFDRDELEICFGKETEDFLTKISNFFRSIF